LRERRRKFSPEFKDEAVKMVIESSRAIAEVAREIQVNEGTLGNWAPVRVEVEDLSKLSGGETSPFHVCRRSRA
jgi:transposase-like protein